MKNVKFYHELGVILVGQTIYEEIEHIFFDKYLKAGSCEKEWIFQKYGYIQCYSSKFSDEDMKKFPPIYFKKVDMDYIFELNFQDLFSKQPDGKIYFLIIFDLNDGSTRIGKPFLKKYSLTVDNEKNTISLFLLENKDESDENNTLVYIIILSSVIVILIGVAGFFAYKLYLKKNKAKKRANELEEDYEYLSKDNNNYKKAEYKDTDGNNIGDLGI